MSDFFRLQKRIDELSAIGARDGAVTRLGLTADEQAARDLVASWCAARGAQVRRDAAGNLFARFPGEREGDPVVLVGSHVDSVPEGGRFDGALGVICAVEAIESLLDVGTRFQRPVEVVAWADEEGARFGIGLFGSAAAFDRLPARAAERADRSGVSVAAALRALGEQGDPALARRDPREIAAYLELHIEQGPKLAEANRPLGVVSDIVGIVHGRVTVKGRADHAGATVMTARADAFLGAAEMALALETAARSRENTVGTVGEVGVRPGAKNVVPGECVFTIDVRAPEQSRIDAVMADFRDAVKRVSEARGHQDFERFLVLVRQQVLARAVLADSGYGMEAEARPPVEGLVKETVNRKLGEFLEEQPADARRILSKAVDAARARQAARTHS